jgi:hypothetical protein
MRPLLFFILIFSLYNALAQNNVKQLTEPQVKSMLCHKWKLSYLEGKGKKMNVPESAPKLYLEFVSNGTLNETDGKKNYHGKWVYNTATNIITTDDQDGKEEYTLITVTNELLVLKNKFRGVLINLGMSRAD